MSVIETVVGMSWVSSEGWRRLKQMKVLLVSGSGCLYRHRTRYVFEATKMLQKH